MGYSRPLDLTNSRPLERGDAASCESKLLGLELIRFICAFAVLLWHYRHFYGVSGSPAFDQAAQPLHGLFAPFFDYGLFGVQLFWGISGFIFFWKYGTAIAERAVSGAKFFWLRFSRLYPLHLATLLLVAMLQPVHIALTGQSFIYQGNDATNFVAQLLMATHWGGPAPYTFNGPFWSVSAEVFVYALFFMVVRHFGAGWRTIAVAITVSLAGLSMGFASPVLFCACYFFAGGAAARLFLAAGASGRSSSLARASLLTVLVLCGCVWLTDMPLNEQNLTLLLLVGTPPLLIVGAQDWKMLDRWPDAIQAAGNLTYSTYLIHFPLQLVTAIGCAAAGVALPVQSPLFLIAYLAATMIAGRWLFLRFERPAQSWIRRRAFKTSGTMARA
jgi:peptidoglycan/LPS O-acetylase OafA/YrhL